MIGSTQPTRLVSDARKRLASRRWCVHTVESPEEIATQVTASTLPPLCAGFMIASHPRYLFLNDSNVSNPSQFLAIKMPRSKGKAFLVIDEVNFDGFSHEGRVAYIEKIFTGSEDSAIMRVIPLRLETPEGHHGCPYCA